MGNFQFRTKIYISAQFPSPGQLVGCYRVGVLACVHMNELRLGCWQWLLLLLWKNELGP